MTYLMDQEVLKVHWVQEVQQILLHQQGHWVRQVHGLLEVQLGHVVQSLQVVQYLHLGLMVLMVQLVLLGQPVQSHQVVHPCQVFLKAIRNTTTRVHKINASSVSMGNKFI